MDFFDGLVGVKFVFQFVKFTLEVGNQRFETWLGFLQVLEEILEFSVNFFANLVNDDFHFLEKLSQTVTVLILKKSTSTLF